MIPSLRGRIATKSKQFLFVKRTDFFLGHWIWESKVPLFPQVPMKAVLEPSPELSKAPRTTAFILLHFLLVTVPHYSCWCHTVTFAEDDVCEPKIKALPHPGGSSLEKKLWESNFSAQLQTERNVIIPLGEADPNLSWGDLLESTSWRWVHSALKIPPKQSPGGLVVGINLQVWHNTLAATFLFPPPTVNCRGNITVLIVKTPES